MKNVKSHESMVLYHQLITQGRRGGLKSDKKF
jgi:hypothetical protein